ncbi:MAG: ATP-grasp domain-containing protein [Acidobacteria bacterium]|nr:ATP-grasp domain-containing protein [Acidobacteriota bacterium]
MDLLILSPGYPSEMPHFTRGAAEAGARVWGVGDQPAQALPEMARKSLTGYLQVPSLWREDDVLTRVSQWREAPKFDRVECLWEPGMILAARVRQAFGAPGLSVDDTVPFRDKEAMKAKLDQAGIRTPKHYRATTVAACWDYAHEIGFPIILKPIAGAGSADTYRVNDSDQLRSVLPKLQHVPEVSVEEFVDGEEYTFDTITIEGKIAYYNIAWYRPRPLVARTNEWISPQVIALRHVHQKELTGGVKMGFDVIKALGFQSGITHMEWYQKADGEVVFGEIGARPPGARQVDQMNFACDIDVFREWGRSVCFGKFEAVVQRKYNVATIFKRAQGQGRIFRMDGRDWIQRKWGDHIVWDNLLPVGAMRRNWRQTLVSDGFLMMRHPDLQTTIAMADDVGERLQLYARP